jgi:hypothetical protein
LDQEVDALVKMDADVVLPPHYFAYLLKEFASDPGLGMASGKTYYQHQDTWVLERCPDFHVVGPCKTYRYSCFKDIGGLIPILGWDILDCAKSRMKGWRTQSYRDLPVYHLRLMGSAMGMRKTHISYGRSSFLIRAHPFFVFGRSLFRAIERPYLSGLWMMVGYIQTAFRGGKRLDDLELARFLRREQVGRLLGKTYHQEEFLVRQIKH